MVRAGWRVTLYEYVALTKANKPETADVHMYLLSLD